MLAAVFKPIAVKYKKLLFITMHLHNNNTHCEIRPEACDVIKKETLTQVFSCEFAKNTFFTEHVWWLPLNFCTGFPSFYL